MKAFAFSNEYFNIKDTLDSGQIFRYKPFNDGFLVFSGDKACYLYEKDGRCFIQSEDEKYFINTFDLSLYWELFFVNLPGTYNVSSGNFVDDENVTEIYIVPSKSYKDFQKKYIFKETEDEK